MGGSKLLVRVRSYCSRCPVVNVGVEHVFGGDDYHPLPSSTRLAFPGSRSVPATNVTRPGELTHSLIVGNPQWDCGLGRRGVQQQADAADLGCGEAGGGGQLAVQPVAHALLLDAGVGHGICVVIRVLHRVASPGELRSARMMSGRSVALQLPEPLGVLMPVGASYWDGGVRVMGQLVCIPGRCIHVEDIAQAEQHAAAVLAAVAMLRGQR